MQPEYKNLIGKKVIINEEGVKYWGWEEQPFIKKIFEIRKIDYDYFDKISQFRLYDQDDRYVCFVYKGQFNLLEPKPLEDYL